MTTIGPETDKQLDADTSAKPAKAPSKPKKPASESKPKAEPAEPSKDAETPIEKDSQGQQEPILIDLDVTPEELEAWVAEEQQTMPMPPQHIQDKLAFLHSILDNAGKSLVSTVKDMPEHWTGRELRLYITDYFNKYVHQTVPPTTKRRYQKDCAERPLL